MTSIKDMEIVCTTEDGPQKLTVADYEANDELRALFGRQSTPPPGRRTLFMGRKFYSFGEKFLKHHWKKRDAFMRAEEVYWQNPLKYFFPQEDTIVEYLNWGNEAGTMKVLHAGVGSGKSVCGAIDWLLDIIPTEPDWPIFEFGIRRREHRTFDQGGVAVVTYQRQNHENVLWPQVIARWCPRAYTEPYLTGKKTISWRTNPKCVLAGTPVFFLVSSQKDTAFVSQALDIVHWDEQHGESKFLNANDRVQRRGGRHIMTMTPHKIEGMAETGAGSFIDRIRKGDLITALDVKFFQLDKLRVNDWVVTKEDKEDAVEEWIEGPMRESPPNKRKLAEGKAKVYGEFHESSGLVLDNFDPQVHVIPDFEVPSHWTWYRFHDHGRKEANACLLVAVDEQNTMYVIDEYYETDVEIGDAAKGIIERLTGNTIEDRGGRKFESFVSRRVRYTRSDPRSLSKTLDNNERTIQEEYQRHGLRLDHGTGQPPVKWVPLLTQTFEPVAHRLHPVTKESPGYSLYICQRCHNTIREALNWRYRTKRLMQRGGMTTQEVPEAKDDHAMTALGMMVSDAPVWVPMPKPNEVDSWGPFSAGSTEEAVCEVTGV